MLRLHLTILQELARLETKEERAAAIVEMLNLLENIMDGKLLPEEGEYPGTAKVNPLDVLWSN